jgi:hypothetical protein
MEGMPGLGRVFLAREQAVKNSCSVSIFIPEAWWHGVVGSVRITECYRWKQRAIERELKRLTGEY